MVWEWSKLPQLVLVFHYLGQKKHSSSNVSNHSYPYVEVVELEKENGKKLRRDKTKKEVREKGKQMTTKQEN